MKKQHQNGTLRALEGGVGMGRVISVVKKMVHQSVVRGYMYLLGGGSAVLARSPLNWEGGGGGGSISGDVLTLSVIENNSDYHSCT